jgi:hypothetical protein
MGPEERATTNQFVCSILPEHPEIFHLVSLQLIARSVDALMPSPLTSAVVQRASWVETRVTPQSFWIGLPWALEMVSLYDADEL